MHAFATNLRFEDDEFNFVKARAKRRHQRGVQAARRALRGRRPATDHRVDPSALTAAIGRRRTSSSCVVRARRTSPATVTLLDRHTTRAVRPRPAARRRCPPPTRTRSGREAVDGARRVDPTVRVARARRRRGFAPPDHEVLRRRGGRPRSTSPLVERGGELRRRRPAAIRVAPAARPTRRAGASTSAIIGAGLGGVCAAIRLEQAGIPYTVFDKNPDVGGTWFENTYPDLRVDVPNHFYSYSFAPNPDWSDYYAAPRRARRRTSRRCAERVRRRSRTSGSAPRCSPPTTTNARGRWTVRLCGADGTERASRGRTRSISAVGMLNRPSVPDLDGLDAFAGPWFHSSRWDHDVDLDGRRVAVVGHRGERDAVRARHRARRRAPDDLPAVAPLGDAQPRATTGAVTDAREVAVPPRALLRGLVPVPPVLEQRRPHVPRVPGRPRLARRPTASISRPNDKLRRIMTDAPRARARGRGPSWSTEVLPDYPPLGKRMLQDNGWFRTLLRDNVDARQRTDRARGTGRGWSPPSGDAYAADVIVLRDRVPPQQVPVADARSPAVASCSTTSGARTRARTSASPCPGSRTSSASTVRTPTRWSAA